MTISAAVELMISERGTHFDPAILDAFLRRLDDATNLWNSYHNTATEGRRRQLQAHPVAASSAL